MHISVFPSDTKINTRIKTLTIKKNQQINENGEEDEVESKNKYFIRDSGSQDLVSDGRITITWELARKAHSQAPPPTC